MATLYNRGDRGIVGSVSSGDFLDNVEILNESDAYTTDMKNAYDYLNDYPLTLSDGKNFSFIHLQGVHLPNKYDRDFNLATDDNKNSVVDGMIQSFKIINLYIGQMKELGVVNFCVYELSELVPEPTSATLSLLALAALAVRRRRC